MNDYTKKQQQIEKYITIERDETPKPKVKPSPHADDSEREEMDENHPNAVEQLKKLLSLLPNHEYKRALEVACCRGLLT